MSDINERIAAKKRSIHHKKQRMTSDLEQLKNALMIPSGVGLKTIGGLLVGFMLVPHKLRLLKFALKTATVIGTARQLLELIPHQEHKRRRVRHATKSNVTPIRRKD